MLPLDVLRRAGLGAVMTDGRMFGHMDIVLAAMIVIAIAGKLAGWLFSLAMRAFFPLYAV